MTISILTRFAAHFLEYTFTKLVQVDGPLASYQELQLIRS